MIRVTFNYGKTFEYYYLYKNSEYYGLHLVNTHGTTEGYALESIVKVEKQVKDLTLEEMLKLHVSVNVCGYIEQRFLCSYWVDENNGINYEDIPLSSNDYIDITELVKEVKV